MSNIEDIKSKRASIHSKYFFAAVLLVLTLGLTWGLLDEIYEFSPNTPLTKDRLKLLIETLVDANYLYQYGHYYSISTTRIL